MVSASLYAGVSILITGDRLTHADPTAPNGTTAGGIATTTSDSQFDPTSTHPSDRFNSVNKSAMIQAVEDLKQSTIKLVNLIGEILIMVSTYVILKGLVNLVLSIILFHGASKRIVGKCRPWLIAQAIFLFLETGFYFVSLSSSYSDERAACIGAVGLIINAYCMWVVYAFINELRGEKAANKRVGLGKACHEEKECFCAFAHFHF
ncbi:uncharacterized protein LOC110861591 isoform X2 [Folsomia candida]|nr:uncharacterized protein LOC110861591 isoform X2 [Folsomia candida]